MTPVKKEETATAAWVLFSTGDWSGHRRIGVQRRMRIWRRRPRYAWYWLLGWCVRRIGRFDRNHVAIGYGGAVLDPDIRGNRYWPVIAYCLNWPTLTDCFIVPVSRSIDLDRYPPQPKACWPTWLRWLTRGRWPTQDCVAVACDALRQGGVPVPRWVVSPRQLYTWLEGQGFEHVDFQARPAGPDSRPDSATGQRGSPCGGAGPCGTGRPEASA